MKNALTALGAPALPTGYFYRVSFDFLGVLVELRQKRRIGSSLITERVAVTNSFCTPEQALVNACKSLSRFLEVRNEERDDQQTMADYAGDHK